MAKTTNDCEKDNDSAKHQKKARPPRDDPLKRHEGMRPDLVSGEEEKKIADLRRSALEKARKMKSSEED